MASLPDYYAVLGLPRTADQDTIHSRWKALLRRYHPDANPGVDTGARAQAINEAYAVLGKPSARAAYDRARFAPPPPPRTGPPPQRRSAPRPGAPPPRGAHGRPATPKTAQAQRSAVGDKWLPGFFLLLLTAAPIGMILALRHEELGLTRAYARPVAITAPFPPQAAEPAAPPAAEPASLPDLAEPPPLDLPALDTAIAQARATLAADGPAAATARSRRCAAGASDWAAIDFCAAFDEAAALADTLARHAPPDAWLAAATERHLRRYAALGLDTHTAFARADHIREHVTAAFLERD